MDLDQLSFDAALRDYQDYAQDVAGSSYSAFENNIARFMSLFEPAEPFGQIARELLPEIDFDTWYQRCLSSGGSMVGSARLDWPIPRREKVAHQLELLRRIATKQIVFHGFFSRFCWVANDFNLNTSKFIREIFVPFQRDFLRTLQAAIPKPAEESQQAQLSALNLVDEERLAQLRALPRTTFDYARLIRMCEELNICYTNHAYHAVAALTRAILDHVPPIFGVRAFGEVASNYGGAKSFKEAMEQLQNSARKIGDAHLHTQIRNSEVLPVATQVNFSNSLDFLLAEVVRVGEVTRALPNR